MGAVQPPWGIAAQETQTSISNRTRTFLGTPPTTDQDPDSGRGSVVGIMESTRPICSTGDSEAWMDGKASYVTESWVTDPMKIQPDPRMHNVTEAFFYFQN